MAVKLPLNQSIKTQYTMGGEYVLPNNIEIPYIGYYYELNGRTFAGKEFKYDAPELLKNTLKASNPLFQNPETLEYAKISNFKLATQSPPTIYVNTLKEDSLRYFLKKTNTNNIISIVEVSKETNDQYKNNPFYQSITLSFEYKTGFNNNELEMAEKTMVGIKEFLHNLNFNPNNDLDTYAIGEG
jgi:hypothetical protein